jgi:hypothetical protein
VRRSEIDEEDETPGEERWEVWVTRAAERGVPRLGELARLEEHLLRAVGVVLVRHAHLVAVVAVSGRAAVGRDDDEELLVVFRLVVVHAEPPLAVLAERRVEHALVVLAAALLVPEPHAHAAPLQHRRRRLVPNHL